MAGTSGRARRARGEAWDRFVASDPGLLRLMAGLRTVVSIVVALVVLAAFRTPAALLVAGALGAMVATFGIVESRPREQAVTLAAGLPVALVAVSLGALLNRFVVAGDVFFVLLIFAAVYARRFGERGTALGLFGFQFYFVSLFVHATPGLLPSLYGTLLAAFAGAAVGRFLLVPSGPGRILHRLRRAFRARLARVVLTGSKLVGTEATGERLTRAVAELRRDTARLHECALMIQGRLEDGTRSATSAALLQRRVADAEIAAERLGLTLVRARHQDGAATVTLHLPGPPRGFGDRAPAEDAVTARLRRDLAGLHQLISRSAPDDRGTVLTMIRNRLLAYREGENLPEAPPAEQEIFRALGEAARAVLGLRLPADGPQDESDDTAEAVRSREELDAEDLSIAGAAGEYAYGGAGEEGGEGGAGGGPTGLRRPTTRAAFQVAVGSALAVAGGELLSPQRWYWAVLTCWVVFLNTSSTGEILVKGYRRLLGTIGGVVAGVGLAGVAGHHTWTALALVLVCVFGMFFTAPLSYAAMSFFVTATLGLLYTLLNTYSLAVLELRIEETALGAACGVIAALLVLPVRTDERTDQQLRTVLTRLRDAAAAAIDRLSGLPGGDLLDLARDLDTALDDFRRSTGPLTHPITPLRVRRRTARYLVGMLETCAYQTRSLAATAEALPDSGRITADPRLAGAGRRVRHNLDVLIAHLAGETLPGRVETGASVAALLAGPGPDAPPPGSVALRVLRHVRRLDEGVVGLARPLGVPVSDGPTDPSPDRPDPAALPRTA